MTYLSLSRVATFGLAVVAGLLLSVAVVFVF